MITTIKNETWGKKKLRNLDFIMPIKSTAKTEGEEKEKKSTGIYRTSQNIRIINVVLESLLSLTGSHNPAHLPRMPSNTVLISLLAVGAAQILI